MLKIKVGDCGWCYNSNTSLSYQYEGYLNAREMLGFPESHLIETANPSWNRISRLKISVMASELFEELLG